MPSEITPDTSDGFHTFAELYDYRMLYNALLFNEWAKNPHRHVYKSWRHFDGELCFGGGWFIVSAHVSIERNTTAQITNHYPAKDWELFKIPERKRAGWWDGHKPSDVADRLRKHLELD